MLTNQQLASIRRETRFARQRGTVLALMVIAALTVGSSQMETASANDLPKTATAKVPTKSSFSVQWRGCSRSPWQVKTVGSIREACWEASAKRKKNSQVFILTGKPLKDWSPSSNLAERADAKLRSCTVYRVYCKAGCQLSATTTTEKDARLLVEAIAKQGGAAEVVYNFASE